MPACMSSGSSSSIIFRSMGGSGHGPDMPEFGAQPPADKRLPFDNELIWHDSTAPETIIDFDASHVSTGQVITSFFAAFGLLGLIMAYATVSDPAGTADVVSVAYSAPEGQTALDLGLTDYKYGDDSHGHDEDE